MPDSVAGDMTTRGFPPPEEMGWAINGVSDARACEKAYETATFQPKPQALEEEEEDN